MDKTYANFFVNNEHFTIEDYNNTEYGVYHEDMFIGTCKSPDMTSAMPVIIKYYAACHR